MTARLREPAPASVGASRKAGSLAWIPRRTLIPATLVGAFLSFVSAFDSGQMPLGQRTVFMIAVAWVATLLGILAFNLTCRLGVARRDYLRRGLGAALLMTVPMGLVVWSAVNLVAPDGPPVSAIPRFTLVALVSSLFFCLVVAWIRRHEDAAQAPPEPAPPKFLERLPLKLRGAEVWAVEAEDHYLRLHTSRGQDLILMRLADAIAELEGIEGAQVHRSWWVARDAIVDARRGDGRAVLTLKDDSRVPVSRTYAATLRERRWI